MSWNVAWYMFFNIIRFLKASLMQFIEVLAVLTFARSLRAVACALMRTLSNAIGGHRVWIFNLEKITGVHQCWAGRGVMPRVIITIWSLASPPHTPHHSHHSIPLMCDMSSGGQFWHQCKACWTLFLIQRRTLIVNRYFTLQTSISILCRLTYCA